MGRRKGLTERINRIRAASGDPLDETDLPDGHSDPFAYFTDEEGEWNHEEYGRVLLEQRGTARPAWVGLHELEEVQDTLGELEESYLRIWDLVDEEQLAGAERRELASLANRIRNQGSVDQGVFESIRAQLVVLGELDLEQEDDGPDQ